MNALEKLHELEEERFAAAFDNSLKDQGEVADVLIAKVDDINSRHEAAVFMSMHGETIQRAEAAGLGCEDTVELILTLEDHQQVAISHPDLGEIFVDRGISKLLERLWLHGIQTNNSCQENRPGIMWICFDQACDVEMFMATIANVDTAFYHGTFLEDCEFHFNPEDLNEIYDEENDEVIQGDSVEIIIRPSVRFPKEHYRKLLRIFR